MRPSFIGHYTDFLGPDDCTYPGSDELLSHGAPVGRKLGLERIGLHVETLVPGRRTSWPHAEMIEEEFVYVLQGHPQAWIDGVVHDLGPGDLVAFPSGTGIAHTILNNTDVVVMLLVGGENIEGNKIFYPLHPARNEECKEKDWFWEGHPVRELGDHDGLTDQMRVQQAQGST